jgi:hypothetical protein
MPPAPTHNKLSQHQADRERQAVVADDTIDGGGAVLLCTLHGTWDM